MAVADTYGLLGGGGGGGLVLLDEACVERKGCPHSKISTSRFNWASLSSASLTRRNSAIFFSCRSMIWSSLSLMASWTRTADSF